MGFVRMRFRLTYSLSLPHSKSLFRRLPEGSFLLLPVTTRQPTYETRKRLRKHPRPSWSNPSPPCICSNPFMWNYSKTRATPKYLCVRCEMAFSTSHTRSQSEPSSSSIQHASYSQDFLFRDGYRIFDVPLRLLRTVLCICSNLIWFRLVQFHLGTLLYGLVESKCAETPHHKE